MSKLSLRTLEKKMCFRCLFKHNFIKFLQQWHIVLAYIKHAYIKHTYLHLTFSKNFQVNSGMFRIALTRKLLEAPTNN